MTNKHLLVLPLLALTGCPTPPPVNVPPTVRPTNPPVFGTPTTAEVTPPPISGGTLLMLADRRTAFAADPDRDAVFIAAIDGSSPAQRVALERGEEPGRSVQSADGRVHVALRGASHVAVIDPTEAHYPADPQGRRNLYTVITRARDRLTLRTAYPATGLLRPAIEGGVLLHELVGSLAPVTFTEADDEPF